jgi:hypothetical protein
MSYRCSAVLMARSAGSSPCSPLGRLALAFAVAAAAGCGRSDELEACDIAKEQCREDIYYALMRLRGDGYDPYDGVPPIRVLTWEEYRAELFPPQPPAEPPPPDAEPPPPPTPKVDPWDVTLQRLGLLAPAVSSGQAAAEDLLNRVAAFYTWGTQTVTIVLNPDRTVRDDRGDTTLLVHELVHAFQDNESDLNPSDGTIDGNFASGTLIEGEARHYEYLAGHEIDKREPQFTDWRGYYVADVKHHRDTLVHATSRFYSTWLFMYSLGGDATAMAWLHGGNAGVRDLARHAPRSSIEYIARHEGFELDPVPPVVCELQPPTENFQLVRYDRFGALNLFGFLLGVGLDNEEAWQTTRAFRDDRLFIYFDDPAQKVALTWRLRFADKDAAERVAAAASTREPLRAQRIGRDVVIAGTDSELDDWPGATRCD